MENKKICKRTRTMWLIRNILLLLVISGIMLCGVLLTDSLPLYVIAGASWLIVAFLLLLWPSLSYKNYSYGYDDKHFYIAYGIIFKHEITAPICQIQDLHFYEGPIMQLFKIGRVLFSTGGSNFELKGLDKEDAHKLIEEIEELLRARIEVNENEEI